MFVRPLPIVNEFFESLDASLLKIEPTAKLTSFQKVGLTLIIMGIFVTGQLNWDAFERRSLKKVKSSRLRWLVNHAKIPWQYLLQASIRNILKHYQITGGVLSIDDTDKKRAKKTSRIAGAHKIKDKASGGYVNGQELIFMVLVTDIATFPVGFRFYTPDPVLSAWRKEDKQLKRKGVSAKNRPRRPNDNREAYPTKQMLALEMLREFVAAFPTFNIKGVLADALYGTGEFMDKAAAITDGAQVVSQLRGNQQIASKNSKASLKNYFARQAGVERSLVIRGGKTQQVTMLAARLHVKAHGKRRYVVALKYEGENEYRYLVASTLSWRHVDIARLYTLRWLVEVFIQDWKAHGGWDQLSKHQGIKGSTRGVILSLLCDHLLLQHPAQSARLKNKQPGLPVGCLTEQLKVEALIDTINEVVSANDPHASFEVLKIGLEDCLPSRDSKKHMVGRSLGRQTVTASLIPRAQAA